MTKRIVSGVFLLVALGALGLILAGALTSGEQLIVRFLTAIIVAALGLYVISDLRLQADDDAVATGLRTTVSPPRVTTTETPPPNSTAAFMATVTGKRSGQGADSTWDLPDDRHDAEDDRASGESTVQLSDRSPAPSALTSAPLAPTAEEPDVVPSSNPSTSEAVGGGSDQLGPALADWDKLSPESNESPYNTEFDEAALWPFTADSDTKPITATADAEAAAAAEEVDDLVAIFARKTEQELSQRESALAMAGTGGLVAPTNEAGHPVSNFGSGPTSTSPSASASSPVSTYGAEGNDGAANPAGVGDFLHGGHQRTGNESYRRQKGHFAAPGPVGSKGVGSGSNGQNDEEGKSDSSPDRDTTNGGDTTSHRADSTEGTEATTIGENEATAPSSVVEPISPVEAASYAGSALAPIIDLRLAQSTDSSDEIETAIQLGEVDVISSLIDQGVLSTKGPISDRDVRTMVYVAFTSSELRKILLAGGAIDGDLSQLDLGQVEVFTTRPTSEQKTLGTGSSIDDVRDGYNSDSHAL